MRILLEARRRVVTIHVKVGTEVEVFIPPQILFAPLKTAQTPSLQQ